MNEPLEELIRRARRVHQSQDAALQRTEAEPRPGFTARVLAAAHAAPDGLWWPALSRAAVPALVLAGGVVLALTFSPGGTPRPAAVPLADVARPWLDLPGPPVSLLDL